MIKPSYLPMTACELITFTRVLLTGDPGDEKRPV